MKTVLITGAGRGLGRATAYKYHESGYQVIATDIDLSALSDIQGIERYTCLNLDVTSEKSVNNCATFINGQFGSLDIMISNAGLFDFYPVSEAGSEKLKEIFEVNVFGLTNLTRYFLPLLSKLKGRLIVISSESHKVPSPFQPYAVSKQALESIYMAIKIEVSLKGVKCILIRPGAIQTGILDQTIGFNSHIKNSQFEKQFKRFIQAVPRYVNNISSPEEVAEIVLKAGSVKNPKSIYRINHNPLVSLLALLPNKIKEKIVLKTLSG